MLSSQSSTPPDNQIMISQFKSFLYKQTMKTGIRGITYNTRQKVYYVHKNGLYLGCFVNWQDAVNALYDFLYYLHN